MKVLIEASELNSLENYLLIDIRTKEVYEQSHIKGAIHLPFKPYFSGESSYLPDLEGLTKRLGELGVSNERQILLYDDDSMRRVSKAFYVFYYLNHSVSILNGGIDEVSQENLTKEVPVYPRATYELKPIEERAVDIDYIESNINNPQSVLIDSRSKKRFDGIEERKYRKAGHIPNAVNYVSNEVFEKSGKFKPADELKDHFKDLDAEELIVSCGSGGSASLNLVALKAAGYDNVKMYSDGYKAWLDADKKVETNTEENK